MNNPNLPDDCQGNNPSFPWNEPEDGECPECGDTISMRGDELHCDNDDCDYVDEPYEYGE